MAGADPSHRASEDRRHLTILVSDLCGYKALVASLEPEDCLAVLRHLRRCSELVITRYGGIVVDYAGDSVTAVFGYPETGDFDARKAIDAALDLHDEVRRVPAGSVVAGLAPLRLHTAIHSGLVELGVNDPGPGPFVPTGEPMPLAHALCTRAMDDEILVSATALGGYRRFFDLRDRGVLTLEGMPNPVAAIQVLGRAGAQTRFEARKVSPFVGRQRELSALRDCFDAAKTSTMRETSVVGPPGVGKSRLIEQFLTDVSHETVRVCRGYCENYLAAAEPLQPFLQMYRSLTAAASGPPPRDVAEWLCERFHEMSHERPLVLFIDDWQWADQATRQLVARLRHIAPRSVLVLTASRQPPPETDRGSIHVIELRPFTNEEAHDAIRTWQPNLDLEAEQKIREKAGGNPLFLEELCDARSYLPTAHDSTASLDGLIISRVKRLPESHAHLLRIAAVIGPVIPGWLLERITGCGLDDERLETLADQDLVYPAGDAAGALRFKHEITRDVIYKWIRRSERRALHRQIAGVLEPLCATDDSLLEPLSYHYRASDDLEKAAHYGERAGDKARLAGAADKARAQYGHALAALKALSLDSESYKRWTVLLDAFGWACVFEPARSQLGIFKYAEEVAEQRGDHAGMAVAQYWFGFIHYALGDLQPAIKHFERARRSCSRAIASAAAAADETLVGKMRARYVQIIASVGQARAASGEYPVAFELLDEALRIKRQHRQNERAAVASAYALACKGAVLGDLGRFAQAHECFAEALDAVRVGSLAVESSVYGWQSAVYLWQGEWDAALECARRSQSLAQRVGSFYVLAMGQAVAAYATWLTARSPESLDLVLRTHAWLEARDTRLSMSLSYGWAADIAAASGNVAAAKRLARSAIECASRRDTMGIPMSYRALAALSCLDDTSPNEHLPAAMRWSARRSPREVAVTLLHQGQALVRAGRSAAGILLLEDARSAFIAMGMPWFEGVARRTIAGANGSLTIPPVSLNRNAHRQGRWAGE